jgi:hypothetical protein
MENKDIKDVEEKPLPTKLEALKIINRYAEFVEKAAQYIDQSEEKLPYWSKVLGISTTAISNKKAARRDWKVEEIRKLVEALKMDVTLVDDYVYLMQHLDTMISIRGYKKQFIYGKAGISNMQVFTRNQNKKKAYMSWKIDEILKIVEAL